MAFKGQAALIIGGANGIGLVTAKELLKEGANVVIADVSPTGEGVAKQLQEEFGAGRAAFAQADVRDDAQMEAAFVAAKTNFHRLDIFINSAGIVNDHDWNLCVDINTKGAIRGMLLAWKHMGKHEGNNGGTVVNISSRTGFEINPYIPIYTATKHSIAGLSRACGDPMHVARTGVRVITLCPFKTATSILTPTRQPQLLFEDLNEQRHRNMKNCYIQKPESVAKGILHIIQHAESASMWVSERDLPVYEVVIPPREDMRVNK